MRRALPRDVRLRRPRPRHRRAHPRPRPARDQAAVLHPDRGPAAVRLGPAGPAGGRRGRHVDRQGRAAPLHELPLGRPGAAHDPQRACASCPRRPSAPCSPTARSRTTSTGAPSTSGAPSSPGCRRPTGATPCSPRCGSPSSAAWSRTSPSACCSPAVSTRRWSWRCSRRRARSGSRRSASASTPPGASRATSSSTPISSRASSRTDHQQILVDPDRLLPAVDEAITAMAEPMVSHDCVAFYLLSQEVSKSVTVVQSGQGADEVFAGYSWYPPLAEVPREQGPAEYAQGLHRPPARRARAHPRARLAARRRPVPRVRP